VYLADNYQFVGVMLLKCTTGCQSDSVIHDVVQNSFMNVLYINSYMDFDDYDNPVKNYIDDRHTFRGIPSYAKQVKLLIRENSVELSDSLLGLGSAEKKEFLNIEKTFVDLHIFEVESYFEILFMLDSEKKTYSRVAFSFLDLFGKLGGVFELLSISMGLLIGLFSKDLLLFSIFKRLYHTQADEKGSDSNFDNLKNDNNRQGKVIEESKSRTHEFYPNYEEDVKRHIPHLNIQVNPSIDKSRVVTDDSQAFDGFDNTSGVAMDIQNYREEEPSNKRKTSLK